MGVPRYWIWCVRPRDSTLVLMAGLGYRRQIAARWKELAQCPPIKQSLQMHQLLTINSVHPLNIKYEPYAKCRTRAEAIMTLLNLRMANKLITVEDWTKP